MENIFERAKLGTNPNNGEKCLVIKKFVLSEKDKITETLTCEEITKFLLDGTVTICEGELYWLRNVVDERFKPV